MIILKIFLFILGYLIMGLGICMLDSLWNKKHNVVPCSPKEYYVIMLFLWPLVTMGFGLYFGFVKLPKKIINQLINQLINFLEWFANSITDKED